MIKTIVKPLEGFEKMFDDLNEMKANLDAEKADAIAVAIAEVEARFSNKSERIEKALEMVSETEEIEVPEEVVCEEQTETVEETETVAEVATLY